MKAPVNFAFAYREGRRPAHSLLDRFANRTFYSGRVCEFSKGTLRSSGRTPQPPSQYARRLFVLGDFLSELCGQKISFSAT